MTLRMKYDDGFAAYINNVAVPVASANAPGTLDWESEATADHNDTVAIDFEDFNISAHVGLLNTGSDNVLAIHGLNRFDTSSDMLHTPELVISTSTLEEPFDEGYFESPTPGAFNGEAFVGIVADTTFSVDRGFFNATFSLDIASATPAPRLCTRSMAACRRCRTEPRFRLPTRIRRRWRRCRSSRTPTTAW